METVHENYLEYASREACEMIEDLASGKFIGLKQAGKIPASKPRKILL